MEPARLMSHVFGAAGGCSDGEEGLDMELARPVSHADFQAAMKKVGPSITRGCEVSVSPGVPLHIGFSEHCGVWARGRVRGRAGGRASNGLRDRCRG